MSIDAQLMILSKIKDINKMTNAQQQLDEFIFTKEKIQRAVNDELDDLFSSVILIQKRSDDNKALKNRLRQMDLCFNEEEELLINKESLLKIIDDKIDSLYWYDQELVKLYLKLGSYRAIQKETGIPWVSCYKVIQKVFNQIKKEIPNELKPNGESNN